MYDRTTILAALELTPGRFAGRAHLEREAPHNWGALESLARALRPDLVGAVRLAQWRARPTERHVLRALRAVERPTPTPAPGRILRLAKERADSREVARLTALLERATAQVLRTASHAHCMRVVVVDDPARVNATSTSGYEWASKVGMSNAYRRKAQRVSKSEHTFYVLRGSTPWAGPPWGVRAVYLTDAVRVRSGRGTSLLVEHLTTSARGILVWRCR